MLEHLQHHIIRNIYVFVLLRTYHQHFAQNLAQGLDVLQFNVRFVGYFAEVFKQLSEGGTGHKLPPPLVRQLQYNFHLVQLFIEANAAQLCNQILSLNQFELEIIGNG